MSRHEPALHHLGLAAHGDESAPVPNGSGEVSEPYRWTSPPPPPPGRAAWRPDVSGDGQGSSGGRGRGTTLGWLATLCAAATLAFVVALLSAGGGSVRTSTSRQTVPPSPASSPLRSGMPPAAAPTTAPATSAPAAAPPASAATGSSAPAPSTGAAPTPSGPAPAPPVPAPAPPASPGSGPAITAISPSSGPAGTAVTLTGSGFYSPSGSILVLFGSVQAPVSCPTQQACVATAPPQATSPAGPGAPPAPTAVPVTVTTDSGRSAPVVFTYTG